MQNIYMYSDEDETRPALAFDRVSGLELFAVKAETKIRTSPMVYLRNSKDVNASFCRSLGMSAALFAGEDKSVENINLSNNILWPGQKEVIKVAALKDESFFEDFKTDLKYSVTSGEEFKGLEIRDLHDGPVKFSLEINKRGSLQLCLLILNNSGKPGKVNVEFDGITQEFMIDWKEWGWAPVTLLKEYTEDQKVDFEISTADQNSDLKISKVYIRYQDVRKTD